MARENKALQGLINRDYIAVCESETVGSTLELLRSRKDDVQRQLAYLYVTNEKEELVGVLSTRDLLTENPMHLISEVMRRPVLCVSEDESLERIRTIFNEYAFFSVPVINQANQLIGIIQASEIKRDFNARGLRRFLLKESFFQEEISGKGILEIVLKKVPWLLISVMTSLVCAYILGIFIGKIESVIALVLFIPIVLGSAGSAGTQLTRVAIREMNEGKLKVARLVKLFAKEVVVGLAIALSVFFPAFLIAILWRKPPVEGIALAVSIPVAVTAAGIFGILSPVLLRTLGIRSEFASGLLALLICDILALAVYLMIALALINPTLELA